MSHIFENARRRRATRWSGISRFFGGRAERARVDRRQLKIETLEPRVVLTGDILITELVAANNSTLNDEDGASALRAEVVIFDIFADVKM